MILDLNVSMHGLNDFAFSYYGSLDGSLSLGADAMCTVTRRE
jgi:hypothetical protein